MIVLEPGTGALASRGEHGQGRMQEPAEILAAVEAALGAGRRPGPSTGPGCSSPPGHPRGHRSGALHRQPLQRPDGGGPGQSAAARGADVTLIAANVALPTGTGIERIDVVSTAELAAAASVEFERADILIMAAAVADFRPATERQGKIVREDGDGGRGLQLDLVPTEDVLAGLAARRRDGQLLVGFAAEHGGDFVARARGKLEARGSMRSSSTTSPMHRSGSRRTRTR